MHMRPMRKTKMMSTLMSPTGSAMKPDTIRPTICRPVVTEMIPEAPEVVIPTA